VTVALLLLVAVVVAVRVAVFEPLRLALLLPERVAVSDIVPLEVLLPAEKVRDGVRLRVPLADDVSDSVGDALSEVLMELDFVVEAVREDEIVRLALHVNVVLVVSERDLLAVLLIVAEELRDLDELLVEESVRLRENDMDTDLVRVPLMDALNV
jgi:hypothetical protein